MSFWQQLRNRAARGLISLGAPGRALAMSVAVGSANRWREQYNPLRDLTMARALTLRESWDRGEFADLMWTYRAIERANETLSACLARREAALLELDWEIKTIPDDELEGTAGTAALAEAQKQALRARYEQIRNLKEALAHLALAEFRGFAHVEIQPERLEPVDQWNVLRDGLRGPWYYNPTAQQRSVAGLDPALRLNPEQFLIAESERHVDFIALLCHLREALGQKDWAAFVEAYGLNPTIVIGPPNVPTGKETEYKDAAVAVAEAESGYLPNGSSVYAANKEKGQQPFLEFIRAQKEDIVLAATGGLLTMLAESGSGTLAGGAHSDTFKQIARGHANRLSGIFQDQLDAPFLARTFPGQPVLAYFELCANEAPDTDKSIEHIAKLSTAGYRVDPDEIEEKTGYEVELKPEPVAPGFATGGNEGNGEKPSSPSSFSPLASVEELRNRAEPNAELDELAAALAADLAPFRTRLEQISRIDDVEQQRRALRDLQVQLPALTVELLRDPDAAAAFEQVLGRNVAAGLRDGMNQEGTKA